MITKSVCLNSFFVFLFLLIFIVIGGCARYGHVVLEDETGSVIVEVSKEGSKEHREHREHRKHRYRYESALPHIPPGHMPPPGKCRIWLSGRSPGQQPPPGKCKKLRKHIPPGAWLIKG